MHNFFLIPMKLYEDISGLIISLSLNVRIFLEKRHITIDPFIFFQSNKIINTQPALMIIFKLSSIQAKYPLIGCGYECII